MPGTHLAQGAGLKVPSLVRMHRTGTTGTHHERRIERCSQEMPPAASSSGVSRLLLLCCLVAAAALPAFAADIHVAQVSRGTDSGDSPDNAHSVAWVNSGANWGGGAGQVSPGDTVYFHGEITSRIDIPGSGASGTGNRVTLDFADASMNASDSAQIDFNAHDYLTVTNVTFDSSVDSGNLFLLGDTADSITVSNCTYVGPADSSVYAVNHQYGSNTLIEGNHFENVAFGVGGDSIRNHDITIRGNTILGSTIGSSQDIIKFGDVYNLMIESNYLAVRKANSAADPVDDFHADVLQSYIKGGGSAGNPTNWTVRYNTVELDTDNEYHRSWTMFENMTGDVYIYSNVFLGTHGGQSGNGMAIAYSQSALNAHIYNNTFVVKDGPGHAIACRGEGAFYFRNNVVYSVTSGSTVVKAPAAPGFVRSNNIYCGGALYDDGSCASWVAGETDSYADTDPLFVNLNSNDFELQPGSQGIDGGTTVPVPQDYDGTSRPLGSAYDIGAFEFATGSPPTVTMASAAGNPTNISPIPVTVTFSEPVTGFESSDILASNGTVSSFAGSGANYSFELAPASDGLVTADIPAGAATGNTAADQFSRTYDSAAPSVSMSSAGPDPTNTSPIPVTVTFSEPVSGFSGSDVSASNATVANFSGSGADYSFDLVPTAQGLVTATIAANAAQDAAGNGNSAGPQLSRGYDSIAPGVSSVVRDDANPTNAETVSFAVTFSEGVTGVDAGDFAVLASGLSGAFVSGAAGSGFNYTVTVNTGSGVGSLGVEVMDNGSVLDAAGNDLAGPYASGQQYAVDKVPPQATAIGRSSPNPTNASSVAFAVAFSEGVTGVDTSDFVLDVSGVTGSSIAGVAGSGPSYVVTVNTGAGEGTLSIDLADNDSIRDSVGNPLGGAGAGTGDYAGGETYSVDRQQPTLALSTTAPDPSATSPIPVTVTFSEPVSGFSGDDVATNNATVTGFAGSGTTYSFDLVPSAQGLVTANVAADVAQDAAGNGNTPAPPLSRTYDTIPAATMTSAVPDPTSATPIGVTVTFTEPVVGFAASDILVSNALLDGFAGAGANYSFALEPQAGGLVTAEIPAGAVQDSTGNENAAGSHFSREYISGPPTVTVEQAPGQPDPTATLPIAFVVTFSKEVVGFNANDLVMTATAPGVVFEVSGSGSDYAISVTEVSGSGMVIFELPAAAATDLNGTPSEPSTSMDNSVTYLMPSAIYVDSSNSGYEDGSWTHPFNTIEEGIATAQPNQADRVFVRPGVYAEDVVLEKGETVVGVEGAYHTVIIGSSPRRPTVTLYDGSVLRGFTVTNKPAAAAVFVRNKAGAEVTNCVLQGSKFGLDAGPRAVVAFMNNVVHGNSEAGVSLQSKATLATLKNNVFASNGVGISGDAGSIQDGALNNFSDNVSDYLGVSASPGDFVADPLFVEPDLLNFHLQLASPCRDAGVSAPEYNDRDGSRNDIGSDGGPGGAVDVLAPQVAVTASPAQGPAPLDVTLDGTTSSDEWGIAHHSWDLDVSDGIQEDAAGAVAGVTYPGISTYTVTLTVTDNSGLTAQTTREIEVGNGLPTASGVAMSQAGPAPLNVQLSGQGDDPDGGPLTWSWDFDSDGLEDSNLQNPTYDYVSGTAPGAYRSILTVTDDEGAAVSDVAPVTITEEAVLASTLAFPGAPGTVDVTDPSSPLAGMTIEFPAGACSEKTVLTINGVASPGSTPLQYVHVMAQVGPAGMVFSQPVTITMPLPPGTNTSQDLEALLYEAASGTWKRTGITNLGVVAGSPAMFRFTATRGASYAIAGEILPAAQFTRSHVSVSEGGGSVTVLVRLDESARPGNPTTVGFATANDTALMREDYGFASGSLVFAEGETQKTVTVPIVNDATDEPQETFRIVITTVEGGTTGATSIVTVSIVDDDVLDGSQAPSAADPPADGATNVPSGCAGLELPSNKVGPPPPEMLAAVCLLLFSAIQRGRATRQRVPVRVRG